MKSPALSAQDAIAIRTAHGCVQDETPKERKKCGFLKTAALTKLFLNWLTFACLPYRVDHL